MQIAILGPLEVRDDAGASMPVAGARLRTLLTRLAVDVGRPVSVPLIVDAIWADQPPADAANAVQTLVSRLRRALGDPALIGQSAAGYTLNVARDAVDVCRFERLAAEGAAALRTGDAVRASATLREALGLWRGPVAADAGPALDATVRLLHERHLEATLDRVEADLSAGNASAVGELEALLTEHPLHERLAALLVTALAAAGRPAEALATYERVRARLADELGADPSPDLQDVHLAVLRGQVGRADGASGPRTNLRAQLTSFVGREDEVARIGKLLEQNRLVTLVGPGGAGKTRLASEAAARILDRAPDGIWFVELAPIADAGDVPQTVLGSLGLREAHLLERRSQLSARDATSRLVEALQDKRAVLVLDNCEHLIEAAARLSDHLLSLCPQLRVLATSREPLGIFGETLLAVPPLGHPTDGASAAEALEYPAVRLFADRAGAVRSDFEVDEATVALVIGIVRRLDGLPLAIELAAARLRSLALADIAARLSDRFRLLTGGSRAALPRHRTLRAVVEWSWDLLSAPERLLAERLAVFPAGASAESAAAVCADDRVLAADVPDLVASLVDKSLLQPVADRSRTRMLETIREYGTERLAERHELGDVRLRHARHYAALLAEASGHLRDAGQLPWMGLIQAERENIIAAMRYLADIGDAQGALEVAAAIGWYWMLTGAHDEAASWLRFARDCEGEADPNLRLLVASMAAINASSGVAAADADAEDAETALQQLKTMGARFAAADTEKYPMLALMRPVVAMFAEDTDELEAAIVAAEACPDTWVSAAALMLQAAAAENRGDVETKRESAHAALTRLEVLGERWGLASCLQLIGSLALGDGDLDAALHAYQRSLVYIEELGAQDDAAWMHLRIAEVHFRRGEAAAARQFAHRAQELSEASGARELLFVGAMLADLARRSGDLETARRLSTEVIDRLDAMPATHPLQSHGVAVTLAIVARHDLLDGAEEAAATRLATSYAAALGTKDMPIVATVGVVTAIAAQHAGDPIDAAERLGAAAQLRGSADPTHPDVAELTAALRAELGPQRFEAAYARGLALGRDEAIERLTPR